MKRLLLIAGTRPEIIKVAPVLLAARRAGSSAFEMTFFLTGQHTTMAREALAIFGLEPDADLAIMRPNQTLDDICRSVFEKLPSVLERFAPDVVLVQGDTTTAAMAALCAFNHRIPVGHIEAGLRSHNLGAPFPEECNRRVINAFARFNFAPTDGARLNLLREGVPAETIAVTGNTVVDALRHITNRYPLDEPASVHPAIRAPFVLITAHRRESFGGGFRNICEAIRILAERNPDTQFVYPVHLNPNVQGPVRELLTGIPNIWLLEPLDYESFVYLMMRSRLILTDSGGIQEEAPSLGKPVLVMRRNSERPEAVRKGMASLIGTDADTIETSVGSYLEEGASRTEVPASRNPFGDGKASERIIKAIGRWFSL